MLKVTDAIKSIFSMNAKLSTLNIGHVIRYLEDN